MDYSLPKSRNLLNIAEASAYLRVSHSTIRRMIKGGALPGRKVGGQIRFTPSDVQSAMLLRTDPTSLRSAEADVFTEPSWARSRIRDWRERLTDLLQQAEPAKVVVNDRRGAKMFAILKPGQYIWGENLWHSSAMKCLDDGAIKALFAGHRAVLFDEMVQNGRQIFELRAHLEALGIPTSSVCLLRRRSFFLSGQLMDPNIVALEDLDDPEFRTTAAFISRLLARRLSPLNVEHLMVSGELSEGKQELSALVGKLEAFGHCDVIWKDSQIEENGVDAWTLDRPQFFDIGQFRLPVGMQATFDGAVKLRFYRDVATNKSNTTFFAFPTITGSEEAWRLLIFDTCKRFDMAIDESFVNTAASDDPSFERLAHMAYRDLCFEISIELLRQAVEVGVFNALGIEELAAPPLDHLIATFGSTRASRIVSSISEIIRSGNSARLFRAPFRPLDLNVASPPVVGVGAPLLDCREILADIIPPHNGSDARRQALSYRSLMQRCSPVMESSISTALDHEIDIGTIHSTEKIVIEGQQMSIYRAYLRGEHNPDLPAFDDELIARTRAVCVAAFSQWLKLRGSKEEGELLTTKIFANLRHDWTDLPPIALKWFPYKFGAVASFPPPDDRPLLGTLVKHRCLTVESEGWRRKYKIDSRFNLATAYTSPLCPGTLRSRLRSLVKAYAAIQKIRVVRESAPRSGVLAEFSEPLTVLASARNEEVAYRCSRFEVHYWMKVGAEQLFPGLIEIASDPDILDAARKALVADIREFAQASRFLYEKIGMYRHLPDFRIKLEGLFASNDLEAGEIILDTVDREPRFAVDLSESLYPMGLIERAMKTIRPFTGFCRQVLTLANIDIDTRSKAERVTVIEGVGEVPRDHSIYLQEFLDATPEVKGLAPALSLIAANTRDNGKLSLSDAKTLYRAFNEICKLLSRSLPDEDSAAVVRGSEDRRRRDFISVASNIQANSSGGYVVVGDIYNFTNAVTGFASYMGEDSIKIALKIQETIQEHVDQLAVIKTSVQGWIVSDTIIIMSDSLSKIIEIATELADRLRVPLANIDKDAGPQAMEALRMGIEGYGSSPGGLPVLEAIIAAYRIGETRGNPRGYLGISQGCYMTLAEALKSQFKRRGDVYMWDVTVAGTT